MVQKLAQYILEHLTVDFEGHMDDQLLRELAGDSEEGRKLVEKIRAEGGFDEFIVDFLDLLTMSHLKTGITEEVITEELKEYAESD